MGFQETFKALSDPARREILDLLKIRSMSAGEIGSHFDMTGATISYHLSQLKRADLIRERRKGNYILYDLNASVLDEAILWLSKLQGSRKAVTADESSK
ncbi:autorepressor SdpR family transcription factor [Anaerolentibacter hominis]|uniref:autorepressor SdpR family transcription factor n=1 Tax=Anaerolentibacter hominis TaxID=3079009 RepID=UPI0031B87641